MKKRNLMIRICELQDDLCWWWSRNHEGFFAGGILVFVLLLFAAFITR